MGRPGRSFKLLGELNFGQYYAYHRKSILIGAYVTAPTRVAGGGESFQMWTVVTNVFSEQSEVG